MPIFEFHCPSCGHQFEELVLGKSQESELSCPKCNRPGVEKLLSVFSSGRASGGTISSSGVECGSTGSQFS